jgi:transposase-like protein
MSSTKKSRQHYSPEYKKKIVDEYLRGEISTTALAEREGLERGQIYNWKTQLAEKSRNARIESIADEEGVTLEQAKRIKELEEELEATQKKLAQTILVCDLLKKLQPNSPYEKKSSGYIETKQFLDRSKGRRK